MQKNFLYNLFIFDWGQARLDRVYDGSLFDASFEPSDSTFSYDERFPPSCVRLQLEPKDSKNAI